MTCHICASPTCLGECEDYPRCKKCGDYMHPNFPCEETKELREPDQQIVEDYLNAKLQMLMKQKPKTDQEFQAINSIIHSFVDVLWWINNERK